MVISVDIYSSLITNYSNITSIDISIVNGILITHVHITGKTPPCRYSCPLYKTSLRKGTLATTGRDVSMSMSGDGGIGWAVRSHSRWNPKWWVLWLGCTSKNLKNLWNHPNPHWNQPFLDCLARNQKSWWFFGLLGSPCHLRLFFSVKTYVECIWWAV